MASITEKVAVTRTAVATSATLICAARGGRRKAVILNEDASINVFTGDASVTSSTGQRLSAGAAKVVNHGAALYACSARGTPTVSVEEEYQD